MGKNKEAKKVLSEWINKQGHDRCWYYPDLLNELCKIYGITSPKNRALPPLEEFKEGCQRYQREEYGLKFTKSEIPVYPL